MDGSGKIGVQCERNTEMYVCACMWVSFCVLERDDQQRQEPGMLAIIRPTPPGINSAKP